MLPLRDHMDLVYEGIATKGQILVALDFDGTLSDIVARPEEAQLTEARRQLLRELNSRPRFAVAVISGRTLEDLRERVGLDDIAYAGHHGLEIAGPGFRHVPPEAEAFRETAGPAGRDIGDADRPNPWRHIRAQGGVAERALPAGGRRAARNRTAGHSGRRHPNCKRWRRSRYPRQGSGEHAAATGVAQKDRRCNG